MSNQKKDYLLENWNRVWQCRDFELSHLWQRSVFLTAFLILVYTGYAMFWKDQLFDPFGKPIDSHYMHHFISVGICFIGIMFSLLWIMMAKGSKFWYECYEKKIGAIEDEIESLNAQDVRYLNKPKKAAYSLVRVDGAQFSVSAINTMIGQISLAIWVVLIVVHTLFAISKFFQLQIIQSLIIVSPVIIFTLFLVVVYKIYYTAVRFPEEDE